MTEPMYRSSKIRNEVHALLVNEDKFSGLCFDVVADAFQGYFEKLVFVCCDVYKAQPHHAPLGDIYATSPHSI